jgi:hypothetical protein
MLMGVAKMQHENEGLRASVQGFDTLDLNTDMERTTAAVAARGVDTRTLQAFMGHRSIANKVVYTAVAEPPKDLGQVSANVVSTAARHCDQRPLALDAERPTGVRHRRCDCVCTDRSVQRWSDSSGNDDI